MKLKVILLTLAVFFAGVVVCSADNPHMGTKNQTVVYEAAGDDTKVTVDGTDGSGAAVHSEWTGKFNGRYYAVTGSPTSDKRSYARVNSHTLKFSEKKGAKVILTGTITVSRSGKTRTVTTTAKNAKGKWIHNTAVYDKQ